MERPELRQFKFDPVEMVLADRGKYIAAILTICRAYVAAGSPDKAPRLASFEGWSDTLRSALIWLGKADPVKSMESAKAEDPESTELGNMLEGWTAALGIGSGSRLKLAGAILKGMKTTRPDGMSELEPTYPESTPPSWRWHSRAPISADNNRTRPCSAIICAGSKEGSSTESVL
jgi:hypothetical protein